MEDIKIEFRFPDLDDNYDAQELYFKIYQECKDAGIFTKDEMNFQLKKNEIFNSKMEARVESLEGDDYFKYPSLPSFPHKEMESRFIEKCIIEITKGTKVISVGDELRKKIEQIDNKAYSEHKELISLKHKFLRYTCEGIADVKRTTFLLQRCTFFPGTKNRFWETLEELEKEKNHLFVGFLSGKMMEFWTGFNSTIMRYISRHAIWRTRWIGATKLGCPLFSGNISEWDVNKTFLVYWSNFYDNIYSNLDDLEDHVIKNDKVLDAYLEAKARDRKRGGSSTNESDREGTRGIFTNVQVNPVNKRS